MLNLTYVNPKYYRKMFVVNDNEGNGDSNPSDETPVTPVKKKYSPGPTIASRLRSMFGNKKQTVATALDGQVSGGGTLVLYKAPDLSSQTLRFFVYKDYECTMPFESYDEAYDTVMKAGSVILQAGEPMDPSDLPKYQFQEYIITLLPDFASAQELGTYEGDDAYHLMALTPEAIIQDKPPVYLYHWVRPKTGGK